MLADGLRSKSRKLKTVGILILFLLLTFEVVRAFNYVNRATDSMRTVAAYLRDELDDNNELQIIANELSGIERRIIAVLAEQPNRISYLPNSGLVDKLDHEFPQPYLLLLSDPHLIASIEDRIILDADFIDYFVYSHLESHPQYASSPQGFNNWKATIENQLMIPLSYDQLAFGFSTVPEENGQEVGIRAVYQVEKNGCYIFTAQVKDFTEQDGYPWQILHQFDVNGIVLWSHDAMADQFNGWQDLQFYIMPTSETVTLSFRILAMSEPPTSIDWDQAGLMSIRSPVLIICN